MRAIPGFLCGTPLLTTSGYITQEEDSPCRPLVRVAGIWCDNPQPPLDWYWGDELLWFRLSTGRSLKTGRGQLLMTSNGTSVQACRLTIGHKLLSNTGSEPFPSIVSVERMPVTGRLFSFRHLPDILVCCAGVLAPCRAGTDH